MELVEIRDLDGPNMFLLQPAIKIEFLIKPDDVTPASVAHLTGRLEPLGMSDEGWAGGTEELGALFAEVVVALHRRAGANAPEAVWRILDDPSHLVVAFSWHHRPFALAVAEAVASLATAPGSELLASEDHLRSTLHAPVADDDRPLWIRDHDRSVPIVAVTGTNGKTTTSRLIAHILRAAGRRVGLSSSSGVVIDSDTVLEGDYTGPSGARRVLTDRSIDIAVLETARGGILLRGVGYESNDVSVFTNVSADHLGLQGIDTVESLADVKATVLRITKPDGFVVLNADDPRVRGVAAGLRSSLFWISREPDNPTVTSHIAAGGRALIVVDSAIRQANGDQDDGDLLVAVDEIPISFGGRAGHMIENALCAAAATLAIGIDSTTVRRGLTTFQPTAENNSGRLNVYEVNEVTVIVDYAHNEAGLAQLLSLGASFRGDGKTITTIIGTAGDRTDEALREIGRLAGQASERVVVKETTRYLRGRATPEEMTEQFRDGINAGGSPRVDVISGEIAAIDLALTGCTPGDVIAMMCIEEVADVQRHLAEIGHPVS